MTLASRQPIRGLTIFVPVLDEEEILLANLAVLLARAERLGRSVQLIVVDNGSTDATPRLLEGLAELEPRLCALRLPSPGVGAALAAALPHVAHEAVVAIDVDLTIDLRFLDDAVAALDAGADVVVGSKWVGQERRPPVRRAASALFTWLCTRALGLGVHDASIGAKAYRTSVLRENAGLLGRGSTYVLELLVRADVDGLVVREVPVACDDRRPSRFNLLHEGLLRFGHLFWLIARRRLGLGVGARRREREGASTRVAGRGAGPGAGRGTRRAA